MKNVRYQRDEQLAWNIRDANEAIMAMPDSRNVLRYFSEREACQDEINKRFSIRHARKELKDHMADPLLYGPYRIRKAIKVNNRKGYEKDIFTTACFNVGWYKKH